MAVAIKKQGFKNIKIYNGGLKDWIKSGYKLKVLEPLPVYNGKFIDADELLSKIKEADSANCYDQKKKPLLTLIDFRAFENLLENRGGDFYQIKTKCEIIRCKLDDFLDSKGLLNRIPKDSIVVAVCETGNRDIFLMRYLYKFGFTNILGLKFGMRGWIKLNYPVEKNEE